MTDPLAEFYLFISFLTITDDVTSCRVISSRNHYNVDYVIKITTPVGTKVVK